MKPALLKRGAETDMDFPRPLALFFIKLIPKVDPNRPNWRDEPDTDSATIPKFGNIERIVALPYITGIQKDDKPRRSDYFARVLDFVCCSCRQ